MSDYLNLELEDLIDLLVQYTATYTKRVADRDFTSREFEICKKTLSQIQQAIHAKANCGIKLIPTDTSGAELQEEGSKKNSM